MNIMLGARLWLLNQFIIFDRKEEKAKNSIKDLATMTFYSSLNNIFVSIFSC